ncbi:MAG: hypothetical protein HY755_02355 [Nitrospirae bacterium]|nr:hypothetical protein [Nitrospirota bacterium]
MYNPLNGIEADKRNSMGEQKQKLSALETGWSKDIIDKNLFSPLRGYVPPPPKPKIVKPVEPPPRRPELSLRGIVQDQFGEYVAYVEKDRDLPVPLKKGDRLEDVEVVSIDQKNVELKWREETIALTLNKIKTITRGKQ